MPDRGRVKPVKSAQVVVGAAIYPNTCSYNRNRLPPKIFLMPSVSIAVSDQGFGKDGKFIHTAGYIDRDFITVG